MIRFLVEMCGYCSFHLMHGTASDIAAKVKIIQYYCRFVRYVIFHEM